MKLSEISSNHELNELPKETLLELQETLEKIGYDPGPLDGIYGWRTQKAFSEWKEENWLSDRNLIGPSSASLLLGQLRNVSSVASIPLENRAQVILAIIKECDSMGLTLDTQKAYVLATVEHETNDTFQPVKEAYWLSEDWRSRNLRYYPYYGRGYVQITWETNYEKYGRILGQDFVNNPDMVMKPEYSLFILVHGMKNGVFTGRRLDQYVNGSLTDYRNARRVINGLDRADHIAKLAEKWESEF